MKACKLTGRLRRQKNLYSSSFYLTFPSCKKADLVDVEKQHEYEETQ
jgi:hypothetical protein